MAFERFSTFTLDQLNELLQRICRTKRVKLLDILGLKIPDKEPSQNVRGKFLNVCECSGIYFTHLEREQAECLSQDIFHSLRPPSEVTSRSYNPRGDFSIPGPR